MRKVWLQGLTGGIFSVVALMSACSMEKPTTMADLNKRDVKLPDGAIILCETMTGKMEMLRGMMFRDSLPPDKGMLFIHAQVAQVPYYTYQVRIPLDIIWMNKEHRVVEIIADTPPCNDSRKASECPQYGGNANAQFVLELAGGVAAKHGLKLGDRLEW